MKESVGTVRQSSTEPYMAFLTSDIDSDNAEGLRRCFA